MSFWLVSTDLDGTLLNHHTYEYQAVLPALNWLKQQEIPVILNSSKTYAELSDWRQKLNLQQPIICENGGVVHLQGENPILIGKPYHEIIDLLRKLKAELGWQFEGFSDFSPEQIVEHTGLQLEDAERAKQRETTEPILWQDSEQNLAAFKQKLDEAGLQLQKGGRFYHVMADHDKGSSLQYLMRNFWRLLWGRDDFKILALGDGENDRSQLEIADIAVVLPSANQQYLQLNSNNQIYQTNQPAPEGWAEAVTYLQPDLVAAE